MQLAAIFVGAISIAVSAFSFGYTLSDYYHSEYIIRERVEKRLKSALDERCELCQREAVITKELFSVPDETITNFAQAICDKQQEAQD